MKFTLTVTFILCVQAIVIALCITDTPVMPLKYEVEDVEITAPVGWEQHVDLGVLGRTLESDITVIKTASSQTQTREYIKCKWVRVGHWSKPFYAMPGGEFKLRMPFYYNPAEECSLAINLPKKEGKNMMYVFEGIKSIVQQGRVEFIRCAFCPAEVGYKYVAAPVRRRVEKWNQTRTRNGETESWSDWQDTELIDYIYDYGQIYICKKDCKDELRDGYVTELK